MKNIFLTIATIISLNCIGQETIEFEGDMYPVLVDSNWNYAPPNTPIILANECIRRTRLNIPVYYNSDGWLMVNDTSIREKGVIETILDKYSEYETECYNDSTSTHTHLMKVYDRCYTQIGNLCEGYGLKLTCSNKDHYSWIHKLPNGLNAEFMEWLKLNK